LKGAVLQRQNKLNEAKVLFQDVAALEKAVTGKDSFFVIPHSLCGLGEILLAEKVRHYPLLFNLILTLTHQILT